MTLSLSDKNPFNHIISQNIHCFPGILITLKGDLPPELLDTQVPLQISLSLPEPYRSFLQPVVNQVSGSPTSDVLQREEDKREDRNDVLDDRSSSRSSNSYTPPQIPDPPFLVLLPTFDHHTPESWTTMYKSIGQWMAAFSVCRDVSEDWQWGREAYWMAFTAAFPHFPNGDWSDWDPRIKLDGPFMQEWLGRETGEEDGEKTTGCLEAEAREDIWRCFHQHVWSRYSVAF
ncbi:protein kinase [Marasmius sp. AFHP31]|nr:protein kinase [Marasmius sp. AFHP31]